MTRVSLCPAMPESGQDRVLVAEDAGLQDLQAMLADLLPVAGKGFEQGSKLHRDQREGIAQAAAVRDDRRQKFRQRKQGQGEDKGAAMGELAFHPHLATMQPDQFFRDVESQPQPLAAVVDRSSGPGRGVRKSALFASGADAAAGVGDRNLDEIRDRSRVRQACTITDPSAGGELDGIVEQIGEHLQNAVGVGVDEWNADVETDFEADPLGPGRCPASWRRPARITSPITMQCGSMEILPDSARVASSRSRDHGAQLIHAAEHGFQVLTLFGIQLARQAIEHERDELVNAGQRRAQFVRNVRQKFDL